jgi:Fic family protein
MAGFVPRFSISRKILGNLTRIAAAREVILHAYLVPKWEVALRKDALVRSAHSSTSIEGNRLSREQVSALAEGRQVLAERKDKQEVLNYLAVLEHLADFAPDGIITTKSICKIHRRLTKDVLENSKDCGRYRDRQVYVGNRMTGEVIFLPPKTPLVPVLMENLVAWLGGREAEELDVVLVAGIAHYEFVRIHPFIDGNGRTARALASLVLLLRDFDIKRFFALDDYYNIDRPAYYRALRMVDAQKGDLTAWLEYFSDGVAASVNAVKERILRLSSEKLRRDKRGQIALTERQMRIIEELNLKGRITNRDVRRMFGLSNRPAADELGRLVSLGILRQDGRGRSVHYILE